VDWYFLPFRHHPCQELFAIIFMSIRMFVAYFGTISVFFIALPKFS